MTPPNIALLPLDTSSFLPGDLLTTLGATPTAITPSDPLPPAANGLCITGTTSFGPGGEPAPIAIHNALEANLPILAIESGMHALNIALGGAPPVPNDAHSHTDSRRIFMALGSKLAETIGGAGFASTTCSHDFALTPAQQAPHTLAAAYSADDGLLESIESTVHPWVIGVQWQATALDAQPAGFDNLFHALIGHAAQT